MLCCNSAVNIKHEGEESWNNMWQKIRSIWKYVHKNYKDDFDWFLLGGDDMYFIMENLKSYLESEEIVSAKNLQKGTSICYCTQISTICLPTCIIDRPFPWASILPAESSGV